MSFPSPALLKNDVFLEDSLLIYCFTFWESPKNTILCQRSRQLPCKETTVCLPNRLWFWVQPWRTSALCFWGMLVFWSLLLGTSRYMALARSKGDPHPVLQNQTPQEGPYCHYKILQLQLGKKVRKTLVPCHFTAQKEARQRQSHARETLSHRSLQICKQGTSLPRFRGTSWRLLMLLRACSPNNTKAPHQPLSPTCLYQYCLPQEGTWLVLREIKCPSTGHRPVSKMETVWPKGILLTISIPLHRVYTNLLFYS